MSSMDIRIPIGSGIEKTIGESILSFASPLGKQHLADSVINHIVADETAFQGVIDNAMSKIAQFDPETNDRIVQLVVERMEKLIERGDFDGLISGAAGAMVQELSAEKVRPIVFEWLGSKEGELADRVSDAAPEAMMSVIGRLVNEAEAQLTKSIRKSLFERGGDLCQHVEDGIKSKLDGVIEQVFDKYRDAARKEATSYVYRCQ